MGFLAVDGTLVVQIVNFIIFLVVMNVVFFRPVSAAIAQRRGYIDSLATDYEAAVTEARVLREQATEKRAAARRDADEQIAQARARSNAEADRLTTDYTAAANALISTAQRTVAEELEVGRGRQAELAQRLAETILAQTLGTEHAA
ncbi:MAG: ATP synthase F0 subunit B [Vulcanimicrobiaceae bacterium]